MGLCKVAQAAFSSWDICQQLVVSSCFILFQTGYYLKVTYTRKKNLKNFVFRETFQIIGRLTLLVLF